MNEDRKAVIRIFTLSLIFSIIVFILSANIPDRTATALSKQGSSGAEVTEIQKKLSEKGYYKGKIDGIYGSQTKSAVISFQKANKLIADGIAGDKTLKALGISSSKRTSDKFTANEIQLLARIISAESRAEPYMGQVAVGAVVLNRIKHPSFPNTLSGVIYQPGAFSCLNDGQFEVSVAESAKRAANDAINGMDPSGGAIYYYNPAKTSNKWMKSRPVVAVIGDHKFCT